eukprot:4608734-Pleurochrysis_carterae.AAC.1
MAGVGRRRTRAGEDKQANRCEAESGHGARPYCAPNRFESCATRSRVAASSVTVSGRGAGAGGW